jgi:acetoin utilization deacetylase AcuC-like enzyme
MSGHDDSRRTHELKRGLERHDAVKATKVQSDPEETQRILAFLHEPGYLEALRRVDWQEPTIVSQWAPPGLPADSPVWAGIVASAFEGVSTAIAAAERVIAGERFTYALCRPPGHHAGPAWMGGYCYLNTAAAAAYALCEGGIKPVAILDLDFHFPTGTSAIVAPFQNITLGSLHASTITEVPWRMVQAGERERFVEFAKCPDADIYLQALGDVIEDLSGSHAALVLSLGYDTVANDPHGSWNFPPEIFKRIGGILADCELPVCVVQEGGYALDALADCSSAFAEGLLNGSST